MIGFDQAVHDFGKFFALDAELARAAGFAESENDVAGAILAFGGGDGEDAVLALGDIVDFFAGLALEVGALQDFLPEFEELFLGEFGFLELSVHGKFDGAGHDQFLARIFGDGAADFGFLEGEVIQFFFRSAKRSADAGGTSANNQNVVNIRSGRPRSVMEARRAAMVSTQSRP